MVEPNKQIDLNRALSDHGHVVRHCGYGLVALSDAAHAMGQDRLAKTLEQIAHDLNESFDLTQQAHSAAVSDDLRRSEEATTNMLRGVFAGIALSSTTPDTAL